MVRRLRHRKNSVKRSETGELIKFFSISLMVAVAMSVFVRPTLVKGQSMEPTLENNDYILVKSVSLFGKAPEYNDLIVFDSKVASKEGYKRLLKRVIGLPGDTIEIKNGEVYRNGELLREDYIKGETLSGSFEKITVGENQVFVLGDNRANSLDSRNRNLGTVSYKDIIGTAEYRLFPLGKIGRIK